MPPKERRRVLGWCATGQPRGGAARDTPDFDHNIRAPWQEDSTSDAQDTVHSRPHLLHRGQLPLLSLVRHAPLWGNLGIQRRKRRDLLQIGLDLARVAYDDDRQA